jgi:predicted nuclease with TOPRIM domain
LEDQQSVERSFSDVFKKYERLKKVLPAFIRNEEALKGALETASNKLQLSEERLEKLKNRAEARLNEANKRLASVQKSREAEVAKLHAMLRKAEMKVAALERTVEEMARDNRDLTQICDELLIAKYGN